MRLWVLGSGSKGNAVLIECGETRVLVDAGFAPRELAGRLAAVGVAPQSIRACVITHEHTDHVKGACAGAAKWGWALHASEGTAEACPALLGADARTFEPGASLTIGDLELRTVPTPHDATAPVAIVATSSRSGARAGVCYDLGHASDPVKIAMRELDLLVLEANHDEAMLRAGPYPPSVQGRIAGRRGHLSNRAAARLARESASFNLKHVVLAHLSESCNEPALAERTVSDALTGTRFRGKVHVAPQHAAVGPFTPRLTRCAPAPEQLTFF
ncbi:MAG TPA: MBL fold metallo-hydrolase [Gemmatimonadaceae bacterium]|nr:MBL fold metallo-hydrolase [Gemmatimonadaceae bacterium]